MKVCCHCKLEKPESEFGKSSTREDGLKPDCKQCHNRYYTNNRDEIARKQKIWRDNNKDEISKNKKEKYKDNKEKILKRNKDWRERNKEKLKQKRSKITQEQRDEINRKQNTRARRKRGNFEPFVKIILPEVPDTHKFCIECNLPKLKNEFFMRNGQLESKYKECKREMSRKNYAENIEHKRQKAAEYRKITKEKRKSWSRKYNTSEKGKKKRKERNSTLEKKLFMSQQRRVSECLEGTYEIGNKPQHTIDYLDCSSLFLRDHIISQWTLGMTADNRGKGSGKWVVDHYVPRKAFNLKLESEREICFNWKNLQPLWHDENNLKSDKLPDGRYAKNTEFISGEQKKKWINEHVLSKNLPHVKPEMFFTF